MGQTQSPVRTKESIEVGAKVDVNDDIRGMAAGDKADVRGSQGDNGEPGTEQHAWHWRPRRRRVSEDQGEAGGRRCPLKP